MKSDRFSLTFKPADYARRYKAERINELILGEVSVDIFAVADFDNQN